MKKKLDLTDVLKRIGFIVLIGIIVSLIGMEIYCWITYWNTPVSDIPGWALFFMFGNHN